MRFKISVLILLCLLLSLVISKNQNSKNKKDNNNKNRGRKDDIEDNQEQDNNEDDDDRDSEEGTVTTQQNNLDSPVIDIIWCGSDYMVNQQNQTIELQNQEVQAQRKIFLLTDKGTIYKSVDHGVSWVNVNEQIKSTNQDLFSNKTLDISNMQVSAYDSQIVYFFGSNGVSYKTKDCGKSYKTFSHHKDMQNFRLNRALENAVIGMIPIQCDDQSSDNCDSDLQEIYATVDGGENWKQILNKASDAAWDKLVHYALVPDDRIIATYNVQYGSKTVPVVAFSDNYFESPMIMCENCIQFYQTDFYMFLLFREYVNEEENYKLKISAAFGGDYQAKDINIPLTRMKDHGFTILDTSEGQIFLSINHWEDDIKIGNIYVSDYRAFDFSVSLPLSTRDTEGSCDFEKILGNEGVYISNVYDQSEYEAQKQRKPDSGSKKPAVVTESLDHYQQTLISYNMGGSWHPIQPPQVDFKGKPIDCGKDCSLHLKGRTEAHSNPIYSSENAPGIILATGNVGLYLSEKEEDLNTYLTRDGGHTWFEIRPQPHLYQIGDHGGLIVMARDDKSTNKIIYSWNQGESWDEFNIDIDKFEITNIVTEPNNMQQRFLVYGQQNRNGTTKGIVINIDFSSLHQRVCSGSWEPGTKQSDYEFWIPTDRNGDQCLFGRKMKYVRRKRSSKCFNSEEFDKQYYIQPCACTQEDWECDIGYIREEEDGPCIAISNKFESRLSPEPPEDCVGYYTVPSGYKKLPGDYCDGGVDHNPVIMECPPPQTENIDQNDDKNDIKQIIDNIPQDHISDYAVYDDEQFQVYDEIRDIAKERKDNINGESDGLWKTIASLLFVGAVLAFLAQKTYLLDWFIKLFSSKKDKMDLPVMHGNGGKTRGYEHLSLFQNDQEQQSL